MAGNSLNTERSNQDKLLQMEKQAAEARKRKSKILIMVAIAVFFILGILCLPLGAIFSLVKESI